MSEAAREAVLSGHCRELKLPHVLREYRGVARQAAKEGWPYEDFLVQLLEAEVQGRRDRTATRRIHEARFPDVKTLDQIDWGALSGISRPKILELASCEYLERGDDVVIAGPPAPPLPAHRPAHHRRARLRPLRPPGGRAPLQSPLGSLRTPVLDPDHEPRLQRVARGVRWR